MLPSTEASFTPWLFIIWKKKKPEGQVQNYLAEQANVRPKDRVTRFTVKKKQNKTNKNKNKQHTSREKQFLLSSIIYGHL